MSATERPEDEIAGERARALLDQAARGAEAARDRIGAAIGDLFRDDRHRLSDLQISVMRASLARLIEDIERDLGRRLLEHPSVPGSVEFREAIASPDVAIAHPILERAGLLRDPALVALLLRRADEYGLGRALRGGVGPAAPGALDALVGDKDSEIAAAAVALLVAESRRDDRLGEPGIAHADLPGDLHHRLVWRAAAALRDYAAGEHDVDGAALDRTLSACAGAILAGHDEGATLEASAMRLATLLRRAGRLGDALLAEAFARGRLALYVAGLAARAGIGCEAAWEMAIDPGQARHAVLLRAVGVSRDIAAGLLLAMHVALGGDGDEVAELVDGLDALDEESARSAVRHWRLDEHYRAAIDRLAALRPERPR